MWPKQAGRPEGGGREAWASVPAPTWTPAGPGSTTLICLASQTLQLFPVSSPLWTRRVRAGEESERYGFSSRNLYIFFKKQANLGKLGTSPANFSF